MGRLRRAIPGSDHAHLDRRARKHTGWQAAEANGAEVDCYVGLRIMADRSTCSTAYYKGFRYESLTSKRLAELVQRDVPKELGLTDDGICGLALPILRETRMPAVELQLGARGLPGRELCRA